MSEALDLSKLMDLSVGDMIEALPFMAGLSTEATLMQVESATKERVVFRITYFGVLLGKKTILQNKKGIAWTSKAV